MPSEQARIAFALERIADALEAGQVLRTLESSRTVGALDAVVRVDGEQVAQAVTKYALDHAERGRAEISS